MNSAATDATLKAGPFRVMVVDDSAIIRGFLSRYLNEDPDIEVVTTANNGKVALSQLRSYDVEVVVLDIEMPEMDGMTALPKIIDMQPDIQVVMASTLTRKNAEISLKALQIGAMDYVPKPETARSVNASIDFRRELVDKVKAWAGRRRTKLKQPLPDGGSTTPASSAVGGASARASGFVSARRPERPAATFSRPGGASAPSGAEARPSGFVRPSARTEAATATRAGAAAPVSPSAAGSGAITLKRGSSQKAKILAVGSSTGGPQALMKFFKGFRAQPKVPIVITQHMPAQFTSILAKHLGQETGWPSAEATDGMRIDAGSIYVAPGGKHLEIISGDNGLEARLSDAPPENFCKPAVDPMLRSLATVMGDRILVVILTGMGHDGLKGARDLSRDGATVLAQDEETSVVWGMPGAVATAGLCTEVLPIDQLGAAAEKRLQGGN